MSGSQRLSDFQTFFILFLFLFLRLCPYIVSLSPLTFSSKENLRVRVCLLSSAGADRLTLNSDSDISLLNIESCQLLQYKTAGQQLQHELVRARSTMCQKTDVLKAKLYFHSPAVITI